MVHVCTRVRRSLAWRARIKLYTNHPKTRCCLHTNFSLLIITSSLPFNDLGRKIISQILGTMKIAALSLALAAVTSANIIFNHVSLTCDQSSLKEHKGCLRGQICNEINECESLPDVSYPSSFRSKRSPLSIGRSSNADTSTTGALSTDGTCGSANGGTVCDPDATTYIGSCCSQYGWCGNDDAHCGTGCQSGNCTDPSSTATPVSSASLTAKAAAAATTRADGMCGSAYGGAICDANGSFGGCCSQYGYCGNTSDHCLVSSGCQSGCTDSSSSSAVASSSTSAAGGAQVKTPSTTTSGEPVIAPVTTTSSAASSATGVVTTDGTCGSSNNNTVCGDWPNGNCCSMYGFCGSTSAHCGDGCQSGNCTNSPSVAAPGPSPAPTASQQGEFNIVGRSGAPAMHLGLLPNGKVFVLDKVENYTEIKLSNGQYAYSTEYNPSDNTYVPLAYKTNAFCSGGTFLPDGSVVSLGGNAPLDFIDPTVGDGFDAIRYLTRSSSNASLDGQDWSEPGNKLASKRWYASAQTMPDGRVFVASGSLNGLDPTVIANNNPTYEMLSATGISEGVNYPMEILEKNQPYYMYPFVHLLSDGSLFVFVSKASERFDPETNTTLSTYPDLPGDYRTYPNTGGSVLLPLSSANNWSPDVIICGGGAYQDVTSPTDPSCGRISPLATTPAWEMDSMPEGRGQVEGTLLPDGTVIFLNGGSKGSQGFNLMIDPTLEALLYTPSAAIGQRFETLASSTIPRLYHSVATLLLDGTLMVTGSNPVEQPLLQASAEYPYVTEFRVENYVPPYLQGDNANKRPTNVTLSTLSIAASSTSTFSVTFTAVTGATNCSVVLYHGGFVTHSLHMGHRMLVLDNTGFVAGETSQTVTVTGPKDNNVAPPGPYVVYVLVDGVPAVGQFVMVQ